MIRIIRIDDKRINRCRAYFVSDHLILNNGLGLKVGEIIDAKNLEIGFTIGGYDKVLPKDYFINYIVRDQNMCGFRIIITSKDFDDIGEFGHIPLYHFKILRHEDGRIEVVGTQK